MILKWIIMNRFNIEMNLNKLILKLNNIKKIWNIKNIKEKIIIWRKLNNKKNNR